MIAMTDADIRYDYTERVGICVHEGGLTEAEAHVIASAQVVDRYGESGREWVRLWQVEAMLV